MQFLGTNESSAAMMFISVAKYNAFFFTKFFGVPSFGTFSLFFERFENQSEDSNNNTTQPAITCSKLTTETLEKGVKYIQS